MTGTLRSKLAGSYTVWRLYHALVADAVSLQRPTKFKFVYEFLDGDLGTVADIGCGPGVFLRYLRAHADSVWAVDRDATALQRLAARQQGDPKLRLVAADITQMPFQPGSFDTVVFLEVLEHLVDDQSAVRQLHRLLKPGGRLLLSVPVPPGEINVGDPWGHKREGYTLPELGRLLESNGFSVERHGFAQFRYSRLAERALRAWRDALHLPAPIFLSWICYLDYLFGADARRSGQHMPSSVIVLARQKTPSLGVASSGQTSQRDVRRRSGLLDEAGVTV